MDKILKENELIVISSGTPPYDYSFNGIYNILKTFDVEDLKNKYIKYIESLNMKKINKMISFNESEFIKWLTDENYIEKFNIKQLHLESNNPLDVYLIQEYSGNL